MTTWRSWLVAAGIAVVVAAAVVLLVLNREVVAWGSVGEWVAGFGALVPLIFWAVDRRARIRAEAELKAERRRTQIRRVSWRESTWDVADRPGGLRTWAVRNDSDAPLRDVFMNGRAYAHHPSPRSWQTVRRQGAGPLGAGQERVFFHSEAPTKPLRHFRVTVWDADGVRWVIDESGHATEAEALNDTFMGGDPDYSPGDIVTPSPAVASTEGTDHDRPTSS